MFYCDIFVSFYSVGQFRGNGLFVLTHMVHSKNQISHVFCFFRDHVKDLIDDGLTVQRPRVDRTVHCRVSGACERKHRSRDAISESCGCGQYYFRAVFVILAQIFDIFARYFFERFV
jgi:hypothetical protein